MSISNNNSEIDLKNIFDTLFRNKLILIVFTFISTVSVFSYWKLKLPMWSGNFNILVQNKDTSNSIKDLDLSPISAFSNKLKVNNNKGETQRLLLSSPLILNSVYKEIINYRKNNSMNSNLPFSSWISSIKIQYANGSEILKISHQSTDKVLLLKTLDLIAEKYKEYSKKEQIKNITNTKEYLLSQIEIMEKNASDSKKLLNDFSIENNLRIEGYVRFQENNKNDDINQDQQRKIYPVSRFDTQFELLKEKESTFFSKSRYLKQNSQELTKLGKEIEYLKANLKRPTEILIKYEELIEKASRDSTLLANLRGSLELLKLEEIKTPDPWQLVSDPIIDERPVSYSSKKKLQYSLVGSLFVSCILVLIKERIFGKIYAKSIYESILRINYIESLDKNHEDLSLKIVENALKKNITKNKSEVFGFINFDSKSDLGFIEKSLRKNRNLFFLNIYDKKIETCDKLFFFFEKGTITFKEIDLMKKYINLYSEKCIGWFYIC